MMKIKDFSWLNWFQLIFFFIWNASSSQRCSFCVCSLDFSPNSKRHLVPSLPALSFSSDCHLPLRCWISRAESRKVFSIVLSSVSYQKASIKSRPTSDSSWSWWWNSRPANWQTICSSCFTTSANNRRKNSTSKSELSRIWAMPDSPSTVSVSTPARFSPIPHYKSFKLLP